MCSHYMAYSLTFDMTKHITRSIPKLADLLKLLRFATLTPTAQAKPVLTLKAIAATLAIYTFTVKRYLSLIASRQENLILRN